MIKIILCLLLFTNLCWGTKCFGCEHGKTCMDEYGKPDSYDLSVSNDGRAYYFPNGDVSVARGVIWKTVHFDKYNMISQPTGYTWWGNMNPPPKGKEPYIMYKGHRWYLQYHGIIYVYKDGKERPIKYKDPIRGVEAVFVVDGLKWRYKGRDFENFTDLIEMVNKEINLKEKSDVETD